MIGRLLFLVLFLSPVATWAEDPEEVTIEEFLQKLSTVPNVISRKDPFIQAQAPFQIADLDAAAMSAPVLERYPSNMYSVRATLVDPQNSRALVKLPKGAGGKVVIVREKDKIGNRGGIITRIDDKGVVVLENKRSTLGFTDKAEITLAVGAVNDQDAKKEGRK